MSDRELFLRKNDFIALWFSTPHTSRIMTNTKRKERLLL